ncbi:hypothetical protein NCC49_006299 [Naganishia albida]|nr:hypothetical protein NCC49_006299 [Naganishia albida]
MALSRRLAKLPSTLPSTLRHTSTAGIRRHNSSFKYIPPTPAPPPPATFSSSGLPQDAHPMPHDMPREDYSSPALYTFRVLGTIIKYLVIGTVTIGTVSLVGVEGAHQYVERVTLAVPAHLNFMDSLPSDADAASSATHAQHRDYLTPLDEDYYAWAEENDSWTGGSAGGTSARLGFRARHALRSAWICQTWGQGLTGAAIARRREIGGGGDLGGGQSQVMKGMIGADARASSVVGRAERASRAGVNVVDPGYEMAEAYIAGAIVEAKKRGVVFPEELSVTRETYPRRRDESVTPSAAAAAAAAAAPERIAVDMLLRHAEILERIATPAALHRSQEIYERVLRSVLPYTTSVTPPPPSPLPPLPPSPARVSRPAFIAAVRESEVLRLAKKIGDVNARIGDTELARGWWTWGLSRVGLEHVSRLTDRTASSSEPGLAAVLEDAAAKSGWFDGWFGRKPRASEDVAHGVRTAAVDNAPRIKDLAPSQSMDRTLKANMTMAPIAPAAADTTTPAALANAPPPVQRSVVALLDSYSTHLAISGDLASAERYQTLGLDIAESAIRHAPDAARALSAAALHTLWLRQRAALLTLHRAEVQYASRAKGADLDETLALLGNANAQAEVVISELTTGRSPVAQPVGDTTGTISLDPHQGISLRTLPLSATFSAARSTERAPATQLLKDAQRTAAEGWNITGLMYENLARTQGKTPRPLSRAQEFEELAMDSYERAMGWNKIAYGGQVTGHHDVTDGEDVIGPANGLMTKAREYWANYARVKSRLDREIENL